MACCWLRCICTDSTLYLLPILTYLHADSWGSGNAEYDFQSSRVDAWLHSNQDCVSHFAAGNYGESDNLDTTITSPAVAKNVVTVGATKSLQPNYLSQTIAPVFLMSVEVKRAGKAPQYISVRLVKADFGGDGTALSGKGLKMVRASPPTACGSLDDAGSGKYKDAIVLARRGTCFFSEKMSAGTAAGAAAVVVVNDRCGTGLGAWAMSAFAWRLLAGGGRIICCQKQQANMNVAPVLIIATCGASHSMIYTVRSTLPSCLW